MNQILAALRSIILGATVVVAGVTVARTSLLGFDVGAAHGLDAMEALQAIDAAIVDQSWPAPVASRASRPGVVSTAGRESLYSRTINAVKGLRGLATMTLRSAPLMGGTARMSISCSAGRGCSRDEHVMAARQVVAALCGEGLNAAADGSTVYVLAA